MSEIKRKECDSSNNNETTEVKKAKYNTKSNDYWVQKWDDNQIGFHESEVHGLLTKHYDRLLNGRDTMNVFLPLCGKSLDIKWLYDKGLTVIGVELAEKAIKDFFDEHGLEFTKENVESISGSVYKSKDDRIRLYQCDIYKFKCEIENDIGAIWDRGSFVAINREDRTKYVELLKSLMSDETVYFLISLDFDETIHAGPPHFVAEEVIEDFYGKDYKVERLEYRDAITDKHREWGLTSFNERLDCISKK